MKRRTLIQAAAGLALPGLTTMSQAQGQDWPTGPVRIIVGFPPGGGTDALARVLGQKLSVMWGQQVLIENKAGVAGVLAAEYTSQQPSDGSTLLMAHINSHALAPSLQPKLRYDVERDFVPIVLVGVTPNLLIAHPGASAKTPKDIAALCRPSPERSPSAPPARARRNTWPWKCSSCKPRSTPCTFPTRAAARC